MVYSFQLWKHPNIHYREALLRLSRCELLSMLRALSISADISIEMMGSTAFLCFQCRELSPDELKLLAMHSSLGMMFEKTGAWLRPISVTSPDVFPEDLPEILKYKGKTNPSFTRMMLNVSLSLTSFFRNPNQAVILDPLCGKATSLFCGVCMGASAVGLDTDRRSLKEAEDYFSRYLKSAGIKHTLHSLSSTVNSRGVPGTVFRFSVNRDDFKAGQTSFLTMFNADSALAAPLLRKSPANILITDLPYGVQHAPHGLSGPESFKTFLERMLPAWRQALIPGSALALSFNALTLKRKTVLEALSSSGYLVYNGDEYSDLAHTVEQAVCRDLVFASLAV